jgi:hypothetical protein
MLSEIHLWGVHMKNLIPRSYNEVMALFVAMAAVLGYSLTWWHM